MSSALAFVCLQVKQPGHGSGSSSSSSASSSKKNDENDGPEQPTLLSTLPDIDLPDSDVEMMSSRRAKDRDIGPSKLKRNNAVVMLVLSNGWECTFRCMSNALAFVCLFACLFAGNECSIGGRQY